MTRTLPNFMRRRIEQAIQNSAYPTGMHLHDGKAMVLGSDLAYMLRLIDALAGEPSRNPVANWSDSSSSLTRCNQLAPPSDTVRMDRLETIYSNAADEPEVWRQFMVRVAEVGFRAAIDYVNEPVATAAEPRCAPES